MWLANLSIKIADLKVLETIATPRKLKLSAFGLGLTLRTQIIPQDEH